MSSIIRRRNGVIEVSLRWSIEPAGLRQPTKRILSVVPLRDTAILLGEAVQSNGGLRDSCIAGGGMRVCLIPKQCLGTDNADLHKKKKPHTIRCGAEAELADLIRD
jgi:hypothetical protein